MRYLLGGNAAKANLLPGGGAGGLDAVIQLYIAWSRPFAVLLDSDGEGEKQKERYLHKFGQIMEGKVFTLADISSSWKDQKTEDLFKTEECMQIQRSIFENFEKFRKKHFYLALQEHLINLRKVRLSKETRANFRKVFTFLKKQLG